MTHKVPPFHKNLPTLLTTTPFVQISVQPEALSPQVGAHIMLQLSCLGRLGREPLCGL